MDELALGVAPLGQVTAWGNPWHGTIVNNVLTLPGGTTKTWPAPTHNACFEFRVPGAPGGTGAVPTGGEWRNYLLVYGNCTSVYGQVVSANAVNWLFARSDGSRWLIRMTSAASGIALSSAALTVDLLAVRFGQFGVAPESIAFSVSLADRGLGTALGFTPLDTMPTSVSIGISDISTDGQKCCLVFYVAGSGGEKDGQRLPFGFFEIVLSHTTFTSSTATLKYNIAQTLGSRQEALYNDAVTETSPGAWTHVVTASAAERRATGCILAAWYIAGTLTPITFNWTHPYTASHTWYETTASGSLNTRSMAAWQVTVGNAAAGLYQLDADVYIDQSGTSAATTVIEHLALTATPGGAVFSSDRTYSSLFPGTKNGNIYLPFSSFTTSSSAGILRVPLWFNHDSIHPWLLTVPLQNLMTPPEWRNAPNLYVKLFSPTLIGVGRAWVDKDTLLRETRIDRFITKSGLIANSYPIAVGTTLPMLSAAYQPVTYAISIAADSAVRSFV